MSDAPVANRNCQLRRDLRSVLVDGRPRAYRIIIDEVSGRFSRVSEHVWQTLRSGQHDDQLWREAQAAGWTRDRTQSRRRSFSPLYFRIPIGSIDRIAFRLAPISGIFFSAAAIPFWVALILLATVLAGSRSAELAASLGSLQLFLTQSDPLWLGVLFIATKVAHELAHALMCRRMGSRCGRVGLLMLCGVPCPYCDVTDIWRQPSAARRAAVMLAGIYIELIIAALATLVWVSATDSTLRLHAMNLMVVCGISTIVFNANPLMRYDGYYILGDLIGSTHLREEAREAFGGVVVARIAGPRFGNASRSDFRAVMLSGYHVASTLYRFVIAIAIAALLLGVAEYLNLRGAAIGVVILSLTAMIVRQVRRVVSVARGVGRWSDVPLWRRVSFSSSVGLLAMVLLFVPLPRYRAATGWVDAAGASTVFLVGDGIIKEVTRDVGDTVRIGETLLSLQNDQLSIQQTKLRGRLRVARLRSSLSRRVTLDRSDAAEQWKTLQAAEDALTAQLASVEKRSRQTKVAAPTDGVVVPAQPSLPWRSGNPSRSLHDQVGSAANTQLPWCRISPDGKLHAVLVINARDRTNIDVGARVRISLSESPEKVFVSTITSVSAIEQDDGSITRQAAYRVLCPLVEVNADEMLRWLGKECKGVFHLPHRTLASDLTQWMSEWLGGGR